MTTKFETALRALVGMLLGVVAGNCVYGQIPPSTTGRSLAPDALYIIPPSMEYSETSVGPIDLPAVIKAPDLEWLPNDWPESDTLFQRARGVLFNIPVHCLEFSFKPVRTIEINLITPMGPESVQVWYLLYRVRYLGDDHRPAIEKAGEKAAYTTDVYGTPEIAGSNSVRFMPNFTLQTKGKIEQSLLDEVIPEALVAIEAKEQVGQPLHDSLSIQRAKLITAGPGADEATWGVALWTGVDPATSFFSVEIGGLTNAQQAVQDGLQLFFPQKTLVLNFFRPGGDNVGVENYVRFGVPSVNRVDGLQSELQKAIVGNEYELTIIGGLAANAKIAQSVRDIAQVISGLGAEQIRPYIRSGSILFTLAKSDLERTLEDAVLRQTGIQTRVLSRTIPLSNTIRELSKPYEPGFRSNLVGLVGEGVPIREVSGRYGCSMRTIAAWVSKAIPQIENELKELAADTTYELRVANNTGPVSPQELTKELSQILRKLEMPERVTQTDQNEFRFTLSSPRLAVFVGNVLRERLEIETDIVRVDQKLGLKLKNLEQALADWQSDQSVISGALQDHSRGESIAMIAQRKGLPARKISGWVAESRLRRNPTPAPTGDPEISIEKDLQAYILEQYGIEERLDYYWTYR